MDLQAIRRSNLRTVLANLERDGYVTREAQALFLGSSVAASRLDSMLAGGYITAMFVNHVEHTLFKPRGWMSQCHEHSTDTQSDASLASP